MKIYFYAKLLSLNKNILFSPDILVNQLGWCLCKCVLRPEQETKVPLGHWYKP